MNECKNRFLCSNSSNFDNVLIDDEMIRMVFHVQFQTSRNREYNHDCLELAY